MWRTLARLATQSLRLLPCASSAVVRGFDSQSHAVSMRACETLLLRLTLAWKAMA